MGLFIGLVDNISKRLLHFGIPVGFDQILQVTAVGRTGIRDVCIRCEYMKLLERQVLRTMVREPSLELSFMPFVVDWKDDISVK